MDQATHTNANTNREDKAYMNLFRDKIIKAIWQNYVSYQLLNN